LRESIALDAAAHQMARGSSLHEALGRLPERPTFGASLHFAGVSSDADIARSAASRFCRDLSRAGLRDIGYAWNRAQLWIIVTEPLELPHGRDAGSIEAEVLGYVNDARRDGRRCGQTYYPRAPSLSLSNVLSRVARERSQDMADADVLAHAGRDGSTPADRVRRAGFAARLVGENIADGVPTAREVVAGWLDSPGHCANIMDARFTVMGVSFATNRRSHGLIYWAQLLAKPR
jgi:uncharacterized protein YkwD